MPKSASAPTAETKKPIVIIGAGPAGLGVAYELIGSEHIDRVQIIDRNDMIGGLARTHNHKGNLFDVGPHRFFTKNQEVLKLWKDVLGDHFVKVPRLTRIMYKNKLFLYPVSLTDVIKKFGPVDNIQSFFSYVYAQVALRTMEPKTFEQWITKNFGGKLFRVFFKTYTEKVWGIPCNEIGAEWAAQRIKNLNFTEVVKSAILGSKKSKAKSLVDTFWYPTKGAGEMYETMGARIKEAGGTFHLESSIKAVNHDGKTITSVKYTENGKDVTLPVDHLFSSMPLTHFIKVLNPAPPAKVLEAADKLYYRDHITVNLVLQGNDHFKDNWVYVHAPEVKMARIANYNNFSTEMVADKNTSAISVEYFVFKGDDVWNRSDKDLVTLAVDEMVQVGLIKREEVLDGFVIRETESYPTYYLGHKEYFDLLKDFVSRFSNLQLIGRGGMYKYNNMDHSLYSGMLAARNLKAGRKRYDVWEINEDADYLEEIKDDKAGALPGSERDLAHN